MTTPFLPDLDIVRRAELIRSDYSASRLAIIAERPGNPLGARIRRYGAALALFAPPFGDHLFNRAYSFDDTLVGAAAEVAQEYERAGVPGGFEIAPGLATGELMAMLTARGWGQVGFHATFAAVLDLAERPAPAVEVRRVENEADLAAFSEAYHTGWGHEGLRVPMAPWLTAPGWSLWLGLVDGAPAGAAVLYLLGADAYLADSAVDPAWRRRGVHRALLGRRCAEARAAGARLIISNAAFLSGSHHNMLRAGLALIHTQALWRAPAKRP